MAEHYTKSTVSVQAFCSKCNAFTTHHVMGGRKGSCQTCIKRLEQEAEDRKKIRPAATQREMF